MLSYARSHPEVLHSNYSFMVSVKELAFLWEKKFNTNMVLYYGSQSPNLKMALKPEYLWVAITIIPFSVPVHSGWKHQ